MIKNVGKNENELIINKINQIKSYSFKCIIKN